MLDPLLKRHFYCSDLSRHSGESLFGTGGSAQTWLLIEYPGGWEPHAIDESSLPDAVKEHLEGLAKSALRVKSHLIKRDRGPLETIAVFVVFVREHEPVAYRFGLKTYDELIHLDFAALAAGNVPPSAMVVDDPLFMVCTHGRRDKCCAKFGFPIYRMIHEQVPDQAWQISHVGGDRFAANVVCFPHGIFYGHVNAEDASAIVREYAQGRLRLKNYRGRACFAKDIQAAEYFVRSETSVTGLDRLVFSGIEKTDGEPFWTAKFAEPGAGLIHQVRFTRERSKFESLLTCHATDPKTVNQYSLLEYWSFAA